MRLRGHLLPFVLFALSTSLLLAQSNPALFAPVVTYDPVGYSASSVAIADVNRDGKPDLLVSAYCTSSSDCTSGVVGVMLGNGDGTFKAAVTYSSGGSSPSSIAVADVNADGKPDLVLGNRVNPGMPGTISVLLGNGDGSFQAAESYISNADALKVAVADINGDGKPDVVVPDFNSGKVSALLGNGDGSFQTPLIYDSGGSQAMAVAVGDVNGDGNPDIVVTSFAAYPYPSDAGQVRILLGIGNGNFQLGNNFGSGGYVPQALVIADVNGDGKPDLVIDNCGGNYSDSCLPATNSTVSVLLGNGDGTFQTPVSYSSGGTSTHSVAVADLNGDGYPDIVATNNNAGIAVLLNHGDGTFGPSSAYSSGAFDAITVAAKDVNGDGKPDLVVGNACPDSSCVSNAGPLGVLINTTPSLYKAFVQPPINSDGSNIFKANRGVIPVKFTLTQNNVATCTLPAATIAVTRTAGGTLGSVDENSYSMAADNGLNFRIDQTACQYVYNVVAAALGVGTYEVDIKINEAVVGSAVFALR